MIHVHVVVGKNINIAMEDKVMENGGCNMEDGKLYSLTLKPDLSGEARGEAG